MNRRGFIKTMAGAAFGVMAGVKLASGSPAVTETNFLTWQELQDLICQGWTISNHPAHHPIYGHKIVAYPKPSTEYTVDDLAGIGYDFKRRHDGDWLADWHKRCLKREVEQNQRPLPPYKAS